MSTRTKIVLVVVIPTVLASLFYLVTYSWAHICPETQGDCVQVFVGRMTGGGSVFTSTENEDPAADDLLPDGTRITHGFELHCNHLDLPNRLEVNIHTDDSARFHLETLEFAFCWDNPNIDPHPPNAPFDSYFGAGRGRYNGESGWCADWVFTDGGPERGEPGVDDTIASLRIWKPTAATASLPCEQTNAQQIAVWWIEPGHTLTFGNHQAHKGNQAD